MNGWSRGVRNLVVNLVKRKVQSGEISAIEIGRDVGHELRKSEEQGDLNAQIVVDFATEQYAIHVAEAELRNLGSMRVSWNGTHVDLPQRFSQAQRDRSGQRTGIRQYPLWMELPEVELRNLRDSLAAKSDSIARDVAAMDRVLRLMREEGATSGVEACKKRGINPQDIAV